MTISARTPCRRAASTDMSTIVCPQAPQGNDSEDDDSDDGDSDDNDSDNYDSDENDSDDDDSDDDNSNGAGGV